MSRPTPSVWKELLQRHGAPSAEAALTKLREEGAIRLRGSGDLLQVGGTDRMDLLHRLSASPLRQLRPGECAAAIFTDDKGRLLDLSVAASESERLILLSGEGRREELQAWIDRYTIMEDVRTAPLSSWVVDLFLPACIAADPRERLRARGYPLEGEHGRCVQGDHWLRPRGPVQGLSHVVVDTSQLGPLLEDLCRAGLLPVDDTVWRAWAVRAGHPLPSEVLRARANPLELGLREWIGWNKGCYIGQEVIARLDTYDKVRRRRAILETKGAAASPGAALNVGGRKMGVALAHAESPVNDGYTVLALLDRSLEVGTVVRWEDGGAGTVVAVPAP